MTILPQENTIFSDISHHEKTNLFYWSALRPKYPKTAAKIRAPAIIETIGGTP